MKLRFVDAFVRSSDWQRLINYRPNSRGRPALVRVKIPPLRLISDGVLPRREDCRRRRRAPEFPHPRLAPAQRTATGGAVVVHARAQKFGWKRELVLDRKTPPVGPFDDATTPAAPEFGGPGPGSFDAGAWLSATLKDMKDGGPPAPSRPPKRAIAKSKSRIVLFAGAVNGPITSPVASTDTEFAAPASSMT